MNKDRKDDNKIPEKEKMLAGMLYNANDPILV